MRSWPATWPRLRRCRTCSARRAGTGCRRSRCRPTNAPACTALLRQLDFHGGELAVVDKELAVEALADPVVARLMTIPGVDAIAGIAIVAAVGDFHRFADADRLVAYVGLNPKVRQSG